MQPPIKGMAGVTARLHLALLSEMGGEFPSSPSDARLLNFNLELGVAGENPWKSHELSIGWNKMEVV